MSANQPPNNNTGGAAAAQPPPPQRRRLQPSEKQLKQSSQSSSSSSCHHHHHHYLPQRQKSFGSTSNQTIMAGLYDLEETLGKGHFATVKAAKHVFTGERVAVKVIDKTKLDSVSQKALLKEVLCMKLVQHPNVVKLYEVIDTSSKMYLVLELGQGDLYDLILRQQGGLPEPQARVYFKQILTAVSYCHKLHVAHRDLKPENVVFFPPTKKQQATTTTTTTAASSSSSCSPNKPSSSLSSSVTTPVVADKQPSKTKQQQPVVLGQVKLTDFGFSNKFCPGVNLDTSCGSLAYSAPEILLGDSYDAPSVDIWSLGVILYMLVCGRAPFQEANDSETLTMIMDVKYSLPDHLSRSLKDLIKRMLVRDPGKRARLHEIETHEWVKEKGELDLDEQQIHETSVDEQHDHQEHLHHHQVPLIVSNSLSENERDRIFSEMVKGGVVADVDEVRNSLRSNAYNHITSTFYLLAERLLREKALRRPSCSSSSHVHQHHQSPTKKTTATLSSQTTQSSSSADQKPSSSSEQQDSSSSSAAAASSSSSPPPQQPPRIRRKNSHVLEDVVLPSAASHHHHHHHHEKPHPTQTTQNIAGLDLETNSLKTKFVCLPVVEPDDPSSSNNTTSSSRNSSPHHPHYYHHLGKRISSEITKPSESKQATPPGSSSSPPRYCNNPRTRINKSHHSHSDSSDEGGGGGGVSGSGSHSASVVQHATTVVVTTPTTPEEEEEDETDEHHHQHHQTKSSSSSGGGSNNNERSSGSSNVFLKPSPSYEGIVDETRNTKRKKKRVLFLSWFFKRSGGGKVNNNTGNGGGGSKRAGGGASSSAGGANGIYKTRSCAELKSRGCNNDVADLNVRECFGVCNNGVVNASGNQQGSVLK